MADCFQELSESEQQEVAHSLANMTLPDAVVFMSEKKEFCHECCIYYAALAMFTFFRNSNVPLDMLAKEVELAINHVYNHEGF